MQPEDPMQAQDWDHSGAIGVNAQQNLLSEGADAVAALTFCEIKARFIRYDML